MEILVLSSLEKVFSDEKPSAPQFKSFSMLKNERSSFQVAFCTEKDCSVSFELKGKLAPHSKAYFVKEIPVGLACNEGSDDFYLRKESGNYPDCLVPVEKELTVRGGKWHSLWIEVSPDGDCLGKSVLSVEFKEDGAEQTACEIEIDVINASLPEQELIYTNWYHSDCLCNYYGVEPFSDEYWRINRNFIKTAAEHGMNCILTPLFTPPLDTMVGGERKTVQLVKVRRNGGKYYFDFKNLKKWIDMCRECGIEYFEMSHLFTQWGAKHAPKIVALDGKGREKKIFGWTTRTSSKAYDDFLRQFAAALVKVIDGEGLRDKCFFHVSDEPNINHLETYKRRAKLIKEIFPGFRVIDALSDFDFYSKRLVEQPIPAEDHIPEFAGKVPELWTYYCCGHDKHYVPNRFLAMPSLRNRVIGILIYKYDIKGFLQWGYNFYNSRFSIRSIDPFKITDADGAFPSGDAFIVYPGEDGEPLESLRLKVLYDGFEDLRALRLLESLIGREKVLEFIDKDLFKPLTFMEYPHENDWLLETREKINRMIEEKRNADNI